MALGEYLMSERPDTIAYLTRKLDGRSEEWLRRRLLVA